MRKRRLALWLALACGSSGFGVANAQTGKIKYTVNGGVAPAFGLRELWHSTNCDA
jgi:hypothetical protein